MGAPTTLSGISQALSLRHSRSAAGPRWVACWQTARPPRSIRMAVLPHSWKGRIQPCGPSNNHHPDSGSKPGSAPMVARPGRPYLPPQHVNVRRPFQNSNPVRKSHAAAFTRNSLPTGDLLTLDAGSAGVTAGRTSKCDEVFPLLTNIVAPLWLRAPSRQDAFDC